MPTYEYACRACQEHLEVVQGFKDDPLTECPACGGQLRKVFGSIGISFKGSGFYRNDYGSGRGRPGELKPGDSTAGGPTETTSSKEGSNEAASLPKSESRASTGKPARKESVA
jgi:putative FmdB family regulatory protein